MKFIRNCWRAVGLMLVVSLWCVEAPAQLTADAASQTPMPRNVKVIEEYNDRKGNMVRVIQYSQGLMKVTETIIMPRTVQVGFKAPINPDTLIRDSIVVFVNKSRYNVQVFYRKKVIRSYKAVFGPKPQQDKFMEGDRCTPEGWFKITAKNPASKYHRFLLIDYPNDSNRVRFNKLKESGVLPATARIGGSVGIHGVWAGGDDLVELGVGWTDGCVALKNRDMEELYSLVGVGSQVYITK